MKRKYHKGCVENLNDPGPYTKTHPIYPMKDKVEKPWGSYEVLLSEPKYVIKRIIVKPEQRLSYQYHGYRDETWVLIEGCGDVTINGETRYLDSTENPIHILRGELHRVTNTLNDRDLVFIEIQTGDKLDEADIIRLEDDYGRADK